MDKKTRMHIVLPREIARELKKSVEKRKWSDFISEAVKEKLVRTKLEHAISQTAGSLKADENETYMPANRHKGE